MLACLLAFPIVGCDSGGGGDDDDDGNGGQQPAVSSVTVAASPTTADTGATVNVTAVVKDQDGEVMADETVSFSITENNSGAELDATSADTNTSGQASVTYTAGSTGGVTDVITATIGDFSDTVGVTVQAPSAGGSSPAGLFTGAAEQIEEDRFFELVDYIGAFDPEADTTWAEGWTIPQGGNSADAGIWDDSRIDDSPFEETTVGGLEVEDQGNGRVRILPGTMTEDAHLTADRVWELAGSIFVGEDSPAPGNEVTLTIEPGTKIVGLTDLASGIVPRLVISRGNKIIAVGTKDAPILMTGENESGTSEWGGLAINGFAPINRGDQADGEAETGPYGGQNYYDNSGILKYVIVAHAGFKFTTEKELNGIAFQGVGAGTIVDYIQVHKNADDGVEFFGGSVNAKHVFLTDNQDDSLDWTDGWTGKVQFVSIHKDPNAGDQGIEADNLEDDNNATPRSHPVLANMTIRGYEGNDIGILLRRGTGVNIYNTIVAGFGDGQIDLDTEATFDNAVDPSWPTLSGQLTMEKSLVWGDPLYVLNSDEVADGKPQEPWEARDWFENQDNFNAQDPQLNDDGTITAESPGFLSSGGVGVIPEDNGGFFEGVEYVGAFDPNAAMTWSSGWTIPHGGDSATAGVWEDNTCNCECPATVGGLNVTQEADGSCTIEGGTMDEDATLGSDWVWNLGGSVFVGEDNPAAGNEVTLTIQPGTKLVGLTDLPSGIVPRLVISRGNKIIALGTRNAPILMTGENESGTSEWGGLAVNGFAPINRGDQADGEAETGPYGGNMAMDDSGLLHYVIVAHAGFKFTTEKELNGIAFQGVGAGTIVDHIQVHKNADDGVEFFGGTNNAKHVFLTDNQDDSLDWTDGFTGKVQFVSIHKDSNAGDQGIEADNLEDDNNATPRSHPVLANMTIRGYETNDIGILLRRGTGVNIYNTIVAGFGDGQIDLDSEATFTNAVDPSWPTLSGELTMENSLVWGDPLYVLNSEEVADGKEAEPWEAKQWFENQDNFAAQNPNLGADGTLTP
jgi:hypothetical protein